MGMHIKSHMATKTFLQLLILLTLYLFPRETVGLTSNSTNSKAGFVRSERNALLQLKQGLEDHSGRLSSWVGKDHCRWLGVGCSMQTGHVTKLDLKNPCQSYLSSDCRLSGFGGMIHPSLLELKSLTYLDLSMNNFRGIPIPNFIGSLRKLTYLNLSYASFSGMLPPRLGNLSNLNYLDFKGLTYPNRYPSVLDISWLTRLRSLKYLNLGYVNLSMTEPHWLQAVNMLPSLLELHLPSCGLTDVSHSLSVVNLTSLLVLNLNGNHFNSSIPGWLSNISTLVELDLSSSNLQGVISNMTWTNLCNLQSLDMSLNNLGGELKQFIDSLSECSNNALRYLLLRGNSFSGSIPASIEKLSLLEELDLSYNTMSGSIPESIGQLKKLVGLHLGRNSWEDAISEVHFLALTNLKNFYMSTENGSLAITLRDTWIPPFSLQSLLITNCQMGPTFPAWLKTQKSLTALRLENVRISGKIPVWLWDLTPQMGNCDISYNQLGGNLPKTIEFAKGAFVDLSHNLLEGTLPLFFNAQYLYLSDNLFSGQMPVHIGKEMPELLELDLSGNFLNGSIPSSISELTNLTYLVLSNNSLSGNFFVDWKALSELNALDVSKNTLSGSISSNVCSPELFILRLSNNDFSGEISFLENCTFLEILDLRQNRFFGTIPQWIGERLSHLSILSLRANIFVGNVPKHLCHLSDLHILDLAQNKLQGPIPPCLANISRLNDLGFDVSVSFRHTLPWWVILDLFVKGRTTEYTKILDLVNIIDLSSNALGGEIPESITNLSPLGTLNLSRNQLTGTIPEKIGNLRRLETLDLSSNHLSGSIPESMSDMTLLNHLNLSYNNLSGQIPSSNQFQTFIDPSIYEGNPNLCGLPLPTKCTMPNNGDAEGHNDKNEGEEDFDMLWFYIGMSFGFVVGFWLVCGTLILKRSWRHAYFRLVDEIKNRIMFFFIKGR